MATTISVGTTSGTAFNVSPDTSGNLQFQTQAGANTITVPNVTGTILTNKTAGTVLQVVSSTYAVGSGAISTSSSSTYSTILSLSITPTSSTSKIYLSFSGTFKNSTGSVVFGAFDRSGTTLSVDAMGGLYLATASSDVYGGQTYQYIDSPATASAITYAFKFKSQSGSTVAFNTTWGSANGLAGILTAMEIAA